MPKRFNNLQNFFKSFTKLISFCIIAIGFGLYSIIKEYLNFDQVLALEFPRKYKHKNVLLFIADNYNRDAGCYGNPIIKTPNIDRLAENGVLFTNAFATVASCSACRSVIFSGLFNHTNGQYGHAHEPYDFDTHDWVKTMPEILNKEGYHTEIIGKFHVKPVEGYPFNEKISWDKDGVKLKKEVEKFLSEESEKPFLLVITPFDPGSWHVTHKGMEKSYPGIKRITYSPDEVIVPPVLPDKPEVRKELALYYQSVSRMDQQLGIVLKALRESGRYDETLIIFTGDGGAAFPGMGYDLYDTAILQAMVISSPEMKKRGIINHAMISHVDILPTILDWAEIENPRKINSQDYNTPPQLVTLMGVPKHNGTYTLPGHSLLPILEEENPVDWDTIYASHTFHEINMYYPMRSIRTREFKYTRNFAHRLIFPVATDIERQETWQAIQENNDMGVRNLYSYRYRPPEELYNINKDPYETHNLADRPEYKDILKQLRNKIKEFQERTDDIWLLKWKYE